MREAPQGRRANGATLRLAVRLEHGRVERGARRLSRPDHELKSRKIALAGVERSIEQRLALATGGFDTTGEHQGVPVHEQTVLDPMVEMANPQLLIDQRDQ